MHFNVSQISALAPPAEAHLRIATALTEVFTIHCVQSVYCVHRIFKCYGRGRAEFWDLHVQTVKFMHLNYFHIFCMLLLLLGAIFLSLIYFQNI